MNRYPVLGSAAIIGISQLYEQFLNHFIVAYPLWLYIDIIIFAIFMFCGIANKPYSYIMALGSVLVGLFIFTAIFLFAVQRGEHIKLWWLIRPVAYSLALIGCGRELFKSTKRNFESPI